MDVNVLSFIKPEMEEEMSSIRYKYEVKIK